MYLQAIQQATSTFLKVGVQTSEHVADTLEMTRPYRMHKALRTTGKLEAIDAVQHRNKIKDDTYTVGTSQKICKQS